MMRGRARPWHCGLLWDVDERIAKPLIAALAADKGRVVGANEPYDGALQGDTLDRHAGACGLANVLVEIRQDVIAAKPEAERWGERLAAALRPILADPSVHRVEHHASRAHSGGAHKARADAASAKRPADLMPSLEAAVYRRLVAHLRERTDVQNIDLMNLAGFCRNCLSNWLKEAADAAGRPLSKEESRALVYGMPYRGMARALSEGSNGRAEGGLRFRRGASALRCHAAHQAPVGGRPSPGHGGVAR